MIMMKTMMIQWSFFFSCVIVGSNIDARKALIASDLHKSTFRSCLQSIDTYVCILNWFLFFVQRALNTNMHNAHSTSTFFPLYSFKSFHRTVANDVQLCTCCIERNTYLCVFDVVLMCVCVLFFAPSSQINFIFDRSRVLAFDRSQSFRLIHIYVF